MHQLIGKSLETKIRKAMLLLQCIVFVRAMPAQQPSKAAFTTFDAPGAGTGAGQGTYANNINTAGEIVGNYADANGVSHGYVRAANGTFTTFDAPGAGTASGQGTGGCWGINNAGEVACAYTDGNGVYHGLARAANGALTDFSAPGAGTAATQGTFPWSLNEAGEITGNYSDSNGAS